MITHSQDKMFLEKVSLLDDFIRNAGHIAVIGHHNPDGDSVGSSTAMSRYLSDRGKSCDAVLPSTHPSYLSFLDPNHEIIFHSIKEGTSSMTVSPEKASETIHRADLIICIDFNSPTRTEGLEPVIRSTSCRRVLIDHHPSPEEKFFDLVFSDTSMSSACELLFWVLMGMPDINGDVMNMNIRVAESLATGMITDTNNFCNSVIPSTFRMASLLQDRGIDLESIYGRVFGSYSEKRMKLMGRMLSEMTVDKESHSACMVLAKEIQNQYGYISGDSEGFVNLGLKIADVETSVLFTEEKDRVRVSLRSKGRLSVNRLSQLYFNGGGHEKASGGKLEMSISKVKDYFFSSIKEFIRTEGITFE